MTLSQVHRFGPYTVSRAERVLRERGTPVAIAPKCVDVLIVLLEADGGVVSKAQLMEAVWPGGCVEDGNLTQAIYVLRKTFAAAASGVTIDNLPKRGYRLCVPEPPPASSRVRSSRRTFGAVALCLACVAALAMTAAFRERSSPAPLAGPALHDYLLALDAQRAGTLASLRDAAALYERVQRLAPNSALGYAGVAESDASLAYYASSGTDRIALQTQAIDAAQTAVAKDPACAKAYAALGGVRLSIAHDQAGAAAAFERALALDPNELEALAWDGTLLLQHGRVDEARRRFERAAAIAPDAAGTLASLAWADYLTGDDADAVALARQMLARREQPSLARLTIAYAAFARGNVPAARAAIAAVASERDLQFEARALHARLDAMTGRVLPAQRELAAIELVDPASLGDWDAFAVATAYATLGRRQQTFAWLQRIHLWNRAQLARDPSFVALRGDAAFVRWEND